MRFIGAIIIHGADTPAGMNIGVREIRDWHVNDNGWNDIGYHWVIRRDGTVEKGRDEDIVGAHVAGDNATSIGICLVGGRPICNYTKAQWSALMHLVGDLVNRYPDAVVAGHRDYTDQKACPGFDAGAWWGNA